MMKYIFYSWQSDIPYKTNKGFQEGCIKAAIDKVKELEQYGIEFSIDQSTVGVSGSPGIADTILHKIGKSTFFIADVSIINSNCICHPPIRKTPNPNVLIELGYAAKVLGWDRIILLFNEETGKVEDLPFDIRFRRISTYNLSKKEKSKEKARIVSNISESIKLHNSNDQIIINDVGTYLVCESAVFYGKLEQCLDSILNNHKFQGTHKFVKDSFSIDIWDDLFDRFEAKEPCGEMDIEHHINISFSDDVYKHNGITRECSISYSLREKFKQINFANNNKVYSVFEITSRGYTPTSSKNRNYNELADEVLKRIEI